mmetsp:Transcript_556/g.1526  ORF Transcript_556/g.1526 Transcript_556/m.1526 type:complete len:242 (-) Transcript_556:124-849(-)
MAALAELSRSSSSSLEGMRARSSSTPNSTVCLAMLSFILGSKNFSSSAPSVLSVLSLLVQRRRLHPSMVAPSTPLKPTNVHVPVRFFVSSTSKDCTDGTSPATETPTSPTEVDVVVAAFASVNLRPSRLTTFVGRLPTSMRVATCPRGDRSAKDVLLDAPSGYRVASTMTASTRHDDDTWLFGSGGGTSTLVSAGILAICQESNHSQSSDTCATSAAIAVAKSAIVAPARASAAAIVDAVP